MKTLRVLLLVLLAVLLPLRGALAELSHCAGGPQDQGRIEAVDRGHTHTADHAAAGHARAPADQAVDHSSDVSDASSGVADQCNFCTASCSTTGFMSGLPKVVVPTILAMGPFSALDAPPPSHTSDGQERPPRSI